MAKALISRSTDSPSFIGLGIDVSGSTAHDNIFDLILRALYRILDTLVIRNTVMDSVKDRVMVSIVAFNSNVYPVFQGFLSDLDEFLTNYDGDNFLRDRPEITPRGLTHMGDAISTLADQAQQFAESQRRKGASVPQPVIMIISDGYPEERNRNDEQARAHVSEEARRAMAIEGDDGNLLLFNIHFNPGSTRPELVMPASETGINDEDVRFLYSISSTIPDDWIAYAVAQGFSTAVSGSHGMISNARDESQLLRFLQFGTLTAPARIRETDFDD